jgi:hypothetical protein
MSTLLDKYRIVNVPEACGGDLTAATITGLTAAGLAAYANTEHAMAKVMAEAAEARAVGVVPSSLQVLLMSRIKEVDKGLIQERKVPGQSIIMPLSYRTRRTNINAANFVITAGGVNAHAGTTSGGIVYPTSAFDLTVGVGPSAFASNVVNIEKHFLPGEYIYVENSDAGQVAGAQTARTLAFKVITSANVSDYVATVTVAPNLTDTYWGTLNGGQQAVFQPTYGVITGGTNSVRDEENYCYNQPSDLSASLIVDWHQTSRYTQCYDDEYERILGLMLKGDVNEYLKKFQYLPLAEQNKLQRQHFDRKWMNSVFFGQQINEKQVESTYAQLPQVLDPENGAIMGYKANALGLKTLLNAESCVIDAAGGPLDLDLLFGLCYEAKRNREVSGDNVSVVNLMTDKDSANLIDIVLTKYLKDTFGYVANRNYSVGQVMDNAGLVKFTYKKYDIPAIGFQIAVFVDQFFTDHARNFGNGTGGLEGSVNFRARGNAIWAIDWSDFNIGIVATASAKREYKGQAWMEAFSSYNCIIKPNTRHVDLRSTTWTTQLGDAKRSFMIENYSLTTCPSVTLSPCAPGYTS